jgi:hypothetical protein
MLLSAVPVPVFGSAVSVKIGEECPAIIGSKCPLFRDIRVQWDLLSFL